MSFVKRYLKKQPTKAAFLFVIVIDQELGELNLFLSNLLF